MIIPGENQGKQKSSNNIKQFCMYGRSNRRKKVMRAVRKPGQACSVLQLQPDGSQHYQSASVAETVSL
jgi:hypothetical protein